jgi:acetolactate synthase I/II/III large subunit
MRAVDAMMECLKAEGVEAVFGIPGGANLPTYDALYDAGIRNVLCRHEQGAGHAAEGYAKATGKVGVALATSGPGATNLVTAIADAVMDSVPTVFLTGQVRTELMGTDGFQEADTIGITMPVVKHSFQVLDPRELPHHIHQAFHVARSGRPGPVLVDIPQDLSRADIPYEPSEAAQVELPGYKTFEEGNVKQIRLAAKALANARRPIIYSGGGVVNGNAAEELRELVTTGRFPITSTVMGLGAFPAPHDQWLGMLGMHGTRTANYAMDSADLIVAVGARFDDRITGKLSEFAPRAKFIHIDVDPAEISKNVPAHIPIVGDCKKILPKLTAEYRALDTDPTRLDEWWEKLRGWQERWPLRYEPTREGEIPPQRMVQALYTATGGEAIVTSDVGQHQMWAAQWYPFSRPRQWINSGGLGTMGFGLPSAIGAKIGRPDDLVVCLAGDGSLIMNCQELATAVEHDVAVKVFIMNNGYLGMVRQWQELFWDKRYSAVEMGSSPDWVKLAEAFGAVGMRVTHDDEVDDAMRTAIETDGPVVLDVHVRKEENCYPMIPAGGTARDMVGGEEGEPYWPERPRKEEPETRN